MDFSCGTLQRRVWWRIGTDYAYFTGWRVYRNDRRKRLGLREVQKDGGRVPILPTHQYDTSVVSMTLVLSKNSKPTTRLSKAKR